MFLHYATQAYCKEDQYQHGHGNVFPEITVAPMAAGRERIHGVFLDIAASLQRVPVKSHGASSRSCQLPRARRPRGGTSGQ